MKTCCEVRCSCKCDLCGWALSYMLNIWMGGVVREDLVWPHFRYHRSKVTCTLSSPPNHLHPDPRSVNAIVLGILQSHDYFRWMCSSFLHNCFNPEAQIRIKSHRNNMKPSLRSIEEHQPSLFINRVENIKPSNHNSTPRTSWPSPSHCHLKHDISWRTLKMFFYQVTRGVSFWI